jgi:hypothetical protein
MGYNGRCNCFIDRLLVTCQDTQGLPGREHRSRFHFAVVPKAVHPHELFTLLHSLNNNLTDTAGELTMTILPLIVNNLLNLSLYLLKFNYQNTMPI